MEIKTVKTLQLISILASLGFCLLGRLCSRGAPGLAISFLVLAIACLIGYFVITILYFKCPYCKRHLPSRGFVGKYCPHCGMPLE